MINNARNTWAGILLVLLSLIGGCTTDSPTIVQTPTATTDKSVAPTLIAVLAWNIESGGNDPNVIARQLAAFNDYDLYCLSEVRARNFALYANALPTGFVSIISTMGGGDRLQILFNSNRFELLQQDELHEHREMKLNNGNHRSPLYARLRDRESNIEFIVMVNHLARRNSDLRVDQAIGMREWARDQSTPVVNVGDFNFDFDFHSQTGNDAFPEMIKDGVWQWIKPEAFIDTNWADPDGDGMDNYPDSMLDFAFVAGAAKNWNAQSRVVVRDGDFPDNEATSDHRPIEVRMTIPIK